MRHTTHRPDDVSGYLRKNSPFEVTEDEVRLPGTGKPITTLGNHAVLVRMKLSKSQVAILSEELGANEFEERAWVKMELIVQQAGVGGKEKLGEEKEVEGATDKEGGEEETGGGRDMSA